MAAEEAGGASFHEDLKRRAHLVQARSSASLFGQVNLLKFIPSVRCMSRNIVDYQLNPQSAFEMEWIQESEPGPLPARVSPSGSQGIGEQVWG